MSAVEFDIIRRHFLSRVSPVPGLPVGIGDDGAILSASTTEQAWVMDTLNGGVHFTADAPARSIGHRALAVNLSDMVAMGAEPRWALLSLSLPKADEAWLEAFSDGFFTLAGKAGTTLAGGDLTRGALSVTVSLLGSLHGSRVLRSGARPDDRILVSGTLGDARAGLELLLDSDSPSDPAHAWLVERHSYPEPPLTLAPILAEKATGALDLSDGLVADIDHLLTASGVGAVIESARLPISTALRRLHGERAVDLALAGGDDYEILCTADPGQAEALVEAGREVGVTLTDIGHVSSEPGLSVLDEQGRTRELPDAYLHFGAADD